MKNVALSFQPANYEIGSRQVMGFQSANRSLAEAFAMYGRADTLGCHAPDRAAATLFEELIRPHGKSSEFIPWNDPRGLEDFGCLFVPEANVSGNAWMRRFYDSRAWSICGVLHSIPGPGLDRVGRLLIDPVEPWDALICTSQPVRNTVVKLLERHGEYLAHRFGDKTPDFPQLPVIPLGIHTDQFAPTRERREGGIRLRQQTGIPANAIVVMYFGRMSWENKGSPLPLFQAMELLAKTNKENPPHLLMAGFYEGQEREQAFHHLSKQWAPSVPTHWLDGTLDDVREHAWHAADIFVSLADNIQETFGLTPIEAMSAGLPVVVSHWDGYASNVKDGEHGFLIPTITPNDGAGKELARRHLSNAYPLNTYLLEVAQCTAVDVEATKIAIGTLVTSASLRKRMGDAARNYAKNTFDWRVLVPQFESLWDELAEKRLITSGVKTRDTAELSHPLFDEPFEIFSEFPSHRLTLDSLLCTRPGAMELAEKAINDPVVTHGIAGQMDLTQAALVLQAAVNGLSLEDLLGSVPEQNRPRTSCLVGWLMKIGAIYVKQ